MKTKLLKLLVVMTISITVLFALGLSASAETVEAFEVTGGVLGTDYTYADGVLTINTSTALTIANTNPSTPTTDTIVVADGVSANITLAGVNIDVSSQSDTAAFKIADNSAGNVTITLADNTTNTLKSGEGCAALQKNGAGEGIGMLTICGTGSLSAQGGTNGAGIGGGIDGSAANITITDKAVVTATGGAGGAGIGGGFGGTLEDLIISGGSVNAIGSTYSDSFYGDSPAPAIGSGVQTGDYVLEDGEPVTPTLADGTTPVYLLEIDNPNGEDIVIDGVDYPDSHGSDTKIYAYVTAENHTVKVGNTSTVYEYNNGSFIEFVHGTQFSVSATKSGETLVYGKDYTYSQRTKVLNILSDKAITIANADSVYEADDHINVAKNINADITLAGVYINVSSGAAFAIEGYGKGNVTVTLAEGSVNVLQSGEDFAGIDKNDDESTLTITGEGSLTAQGGAYAPGIGAGEATSNITIKGGNITATGGDGGAGIGGGYNGTSRNITITGTAVVTATGYGGAAGIGGGYSGTLEDIFITGGSVKAVGGIYVDEYFGDAKGAPIGGGVFTDFEVLMDGDSVTPTLADDKTRVYLLEISNPNGEDIVIDGVDFPDKHGDENKIYAYVSLTVHTIKVGDTSTVYEYLNGAFTEMVHGTDLSVSATNSGETLVHGVDYTYSSATGILTVLTDKAITIANADSVEETDDRIIVVKNTDANITLAGVNINASSGAAFEIADNSTGDVTLTLADGSVNTLKGASYYAGLQKNGADENVGKLTICGTGSLSAQGGTDSAGIGGENKSSTRNITISGGVVVTATGGVGSAGIGGGYGGSAKDITITDNAVVTATGDTYGAGIGGGKGGSATDIKITDKAVVTASGKDGGAGIGGGVDGTLEDIIINGGSVNAIGSYYYEETVGGADGANIGGGVILPPDPHSEPEEGAPVTPTLVDGTTPVYLLELDVDGTSAVTINGKAYPKKHFDENKVYIYLPAKTAQAPNEVTVGNETTKYCYINAKWLKVVDSPEADDTEFTYDGTEKTYTLAESENYTITGNTAQTTAGTYTVTVALNDKDNTVWNDGTTDDKTFTFTIAKATVTVTAKSYTIKVGDTLPTYAYNVTGLVNGETLPIDVTISCTADGKTAGTYDIVVSGDAENDNYKFTYVNGTLKINAASAPQNVKATAGDSKITISWSAVSGATKYRVQRLNGTTWSTINYPTATSYTDTNVTEGNTYKYRVLAYVGGAWGKISSVAEATAYSTIPRELKATAGEGSVKLSWKAVENATKYRVQRLNGTTWSTINYPTATSYVDTAVTAGTTYKYRVLAYVDGAWGKVSSAVSATPTASTTPQNVKAVAGDGKITISWSAVSGATKYRVQRLNGTAWSTINYPTAISYVDTNVTAGTTYKYRVLAYVDSAWGKISSVVSATPTASTTPQNVKAVAGDGKITISWSAVRGATKYRVQRLNGASWSTVKYPTATTYTDTGLTNGTAYKYRVLAYVNGVWSTASSAVSATPKANTIPQNVKAEAGDGEITISWSAVKNATKYRVQRYNGSSWATVKYPTATSYTDTDVTAGTAYKYRVLAYVDGAWSAVSVVVTATPN